MRQWKAITTHEARMETGLPQTVRKLVFSGLGISLLAGTFLSILAPYGTGTISFIPRFIYWTVLCGAGGVGAGLFLPLARRLKWNPGEPFTIFGQSITSSILVTFMLVAWNYWHSSHVNGIEALILFFFVWVIGITITTIAHLAERGSDPAIKTSEKTPDIIARLKPKFRSSKIYALASEDHYVRVYTDTGEDLILMRLGDAIKECTPLSGLQTHRSWWVAEQGVKSVTRSEGKMQIELHSGQRVPVSRSNSKAVKEAGWS